MEKKTLASVITLVLINTTDAIMGAVIGPTLIFYVTELGGTKEEYGMMTSVICLAMFFMTSVYGLWVDANGNKFRTPFMTSFLLGLVSSLMYFAAILLPKGPIATYTLMFSRFIAGLSYAGRTLAYSWVHSAIPLDKQTTILSVLSMSQIFGSIFGPLMALLVSKIDTHLSIGNLLDIPINGNNSIGLLMAGIEVFLALVMLTFLQDPQEKVKTKGEMKGEDQEATTSWGGVRAVFSNFDLFFPIFISFVTVCNFSVLMVALSPVAKHALGWNAFDISCLSPITSIVSTIGMAVFFVATTKDIPNAFMMTFGFSCFAVGGAAMYFTWIKDQANILEFTWPLFLMCFGHPFIGPSTRSMFSTALKSRPELDGAIGIMLGLLTQSGALSGMIAPFLVTKFVLRSPQEIDASSNKHELTKGAWYVPIISFIIIIGLLYSYFFVKKQEQEEEADGDGENTASETSKLLSSTEKGRGASKLLSSTKKGSSRRSSILQINQSFSRKSFVNGRLSVEMNRMMNPFDTKEEMEFRKQLLKDKEEWEEIRKQADMEDA